MTQVRISACLALALTASIAQAQTGTPLAGMSIEELLNLRVTATTKMDAMSIRRAPGVVRVFTREDIERFGFVTLRDVLANVPGVQIQEYRAGHQAVWFRGIKQRYNNKILWIIDGVPLRDSFYGHQAVDEGVPLGMVERIEIITGPGSVLYGTNAFAGVVSITTRSAGAGHEARNLRGAYGTNASGEQGAEFAGGPFYGFVDHVSTSGFSPDLNSDGLAWQHVQDRQRTYGLFKVGGAGLEATASFFNHTYADTYRRSGRDRFFSRDPAYGSLRYHRELTPSVELKVLGYYESYPLKRTDIRFAAPGQVSQTNEDVYNTSLMGVDTDLSYHRGSHSVIAGTSVQMDRSNTIVSRQVASISTTSPSLVVEQVSRRDVGLFVQDVWALTPSIDVTSGVRYDALSAFSNEFSYRTALTGEHAGLYGKLLFGTAFRVPSYREYLDFTSYNPVLRPEHLQTLEAQVGRKFKRADVNLTFYNNTYRDLIKEILVKTIATPTGVRRLNTEYSINAPTSTIRGLEFLAHVYPLDRLDVTIGLSHLLSATETIGELDRAITPTVPVESGPADVQFLARYTVNSLIDYRLTSRGDHVGLAATGTSSRLVPPDYQSAVPAAERDPSNAAGFVRLDAFSAIRLTASLRLNVRAVNILDQRIYSPPFDHATEYDAQWQGRSFRAELTLKY